MSLPHGTFLAVLLQNIGYILRQNLPWEKKKGKHNPCAHCPMIPKSYAYGERHMGSVRERGCVYVWEGRSLASKYIPLIKLVILQIPHLCFLFLDQAPSHTLPHFLSLLHSPLELMHTKLCLHCRCLVGNHMNLHGTAGLLCKCPSVYLPPSFTLSLPSTQSWEIHVRWIWNRVHLSLTTLCGEGEALTQGKHIHARWKILSVTLTFEAFSFELH